MLKELLTSNGSTAGQFLKPLHLSATSWDHTGCPGLVYCPVMQNQKRNNLSLMLTSLVQRSYQTEVWSSMLNLQSYVVLSQRTCFIFVLLVKTDLSVSKIDPSRGLTCAAAETSTAWCICQMFGQNRTATACVHIEADPYRSAREQTRDTQPNSV